MLYCRSCGIFKKQSVPSPEVLKNRLNGFMIASLAAREKAVEKVRQVYEQMSWFMKRIPAAGKLFDVGASGGFMMAVARDVMGWEVDGNEISSKSIQWARDIFDMDIRHGLLEELDIPESEFDLVIFWHTLEHIIDLKQSLKKAAFMLKPGGRLVVAVPRRESPYELRQRYIADHIHEFSGRALKLLLSRAGFEEQECKTYNGAPWTKEINVIYRWAG
jgi:2-polyprenyl-3-methyl-5-hydroxy-6-metoxy-1,4-benzoquinol methylase